MITQCLLADSPLSFYKTPFYFCPRVLKYKFEHSVLLLASHSQIQMKLHWQSLPNNEQMIVEWVTERIPPGKITVLNPSWGLNFRRINICYILNKPFAESAFLKTASHFQEEVSFLWELFGVPENCHEMYILLSLRLSIIRQRQGFVQREAVGHSLFRAAGSIFVIIWFIY